MNDEIPYGFRKAEAEQIRRKCGAGIRFGQRIDNAPVPLAQMAVARTSSTITARSGTTLGSGTATLYDCSGGTLTATSISETVYNLSTTSIATSRYIMIQREYITGLWLVVYEDC
jgi:hypothetical protein